MTRRASKKTKSAAQPARASSKPVRRSKAPPEIARATAAAGAQPVTPLSETAGTAIVGLTRDLRIAEWNRDAEHIYRRTREEVLGQPYLETCVPVPHRAYVEKELARALAGRPSEGFEKPVSGGAGDERVLLWSLTRVPHEGRETVGLLAIGHDVTERRRSLERAEESQAQLDRIIHSAMDGIITVDEDQKITLFNQAAEQMFNCPAGEALGQSLDRFIPERFRTAHQDHVRRFAKTNVTSRTMGGLGTVFGLRTNGEEFPVEASISRVEVQGRKLLTVILRDISPRIEAEERATTFGRILEDSRNEIYLFDADSLYFTQVNRGARENLGYSMSELLALTPLDIKPEMTKDSFEQHLQALRTGEKQVVRFATVHCRKNRTTYPVDVQLQMATLPTGRVFIAIILDLTERARAEDQLRQAERLAELGLVASGLAHEIGTPMNVILGRAEYLLGRTQDETLRKGLSTIVRQVERITKIMNQLLNYARRRRIEPRPTDLRRTIEDSLEILREKIEKQNIQIETRFEEPSSMALADPDQISQVMLNLMLNAIHAMPDGGTLSVSLTQTDELVRLSIRDSGHGIPTENLTRIFDPFFTTKEVGQGTGLGLNVVRRIIQEHHGTIEVESEAGEGTAFTIRLPLHTGSGND